MATSGSYLAFLGLYPSRSFSDLKQTDLQTRVIRSSSVL